MTRTRFPAYLTFALLAALALVAGLFLSQPHETGRGPEQEAAAGTGAAIDALPAAAISGRVLDRYGEPVAGIRLELLDIGRPRDAQTAAKGGATSFTTSTDQDGGFGFDHLRPVEHELTTENSARYASVRRIVHPGEGSVTLTLEEREFIRISGVVSDEAGTPLEDVRVLPLQLGSEAAPTDADGAYQFDLPFSPEVAEYTVRFVREGYREASLLFSYSELESAPGIDRTITLREEGPHVSLSGVLADELGAPVSGETIHLYSNLQRARYSVESDADGRFEFGRVAASGDYRLWVVPLGPWRDYTIPNLALTSSVPALHITLGPLATAPFEGRLVNDAGDGIAYQHLVLTSELARGKPLDLFSGADGSFYVEAVPEGRLSLRTSISPYVRIEGLDQAADSSASMEIPLDLGDHELAGRVENADGAPIARAKVNVLGSRQRGVVTSEVRWSAMTDERGEFQLGGLGDGPYGLTVSAPGYDEITVAPDVTTGWVHVIVTPPHQG